MPSSTTSLTIDPDARDQDTRDQDAWQAPDGVLPLRWTPDHVGVRLVEALHTLDRLPRPKGPRAAGNHWPRHRVEWADQLAQAELPEAERRTRAAQHLAQSLRPSGAEIARMDRVLDWLRDLRTERPETATLLTLWALRTARRRSLRALCRELGITPPTFYKRRGQALVLLAESLEARGTSVF